MRREIWLILVLVSPMVGCSPAFLANHGVDAELFPEPEKDSITFWGHATNYIDVSGFGIVTDPVFENGYSPWHGREIPAPPSSAYDQANIILISHAHRDHLHPESIARFSEGTVILCPEPSRKHVEDLGFEVRVMRPGDEYEYPGGKIVAVPAHHPGGRYSIKANHDGDALGYVVYTPSQRIYYSGDTEYFQGMFEIGRDHRPHVAILNINGHLNSYDAILAIGALGAPEVIPSHFGAYAGSNARRSPGWHADLRRLMGDVIVSLDVGDSHFWRGGDLASDTATPAVSSAGD